MTKKLLLDDEVSEEPDFLKVNNDYAKRYEERKRKQELGQCKLNDESSLAFIDFL